MQLLMRETEAFQNGPQEAEDTLQPEAWAGRL